MKQHRDSPETDTYSRVDYRRFVAWPVRIQREGPLLESLLKGLPERSLLDLGCGTGEHSRFFASKDCTVTGVDHSKTMIEKARAGEPNPNLRFIEGDICSLDSLLEKRFGGATSLGNTLPHILDESSLRSFLGGLSRVLLPGAPFLFQLLNYERIMEQEIRYLPVNFARKRTMNWSFYDSCNLNPTIESSFVPPRSALIQAVTSRWK